MTDSDAAGVRRIAVVTGGDSGIGAACAEVLAERGFDLAILYRNDQQSADQVVARIETTGRRVIAIKADVSSEADVEVAFDQVRTALGVAAILVNSAGLNMSGVDVADMALDQWQRLIGVDLTGTFLACRRFVRDYRDAGLIMGSIINITSIHASAMRAGGADYTAAKGGQTNLGATLALELAPLNITVNSIAPGMILTDMNEQASNDDDYRAKLERAIPIGRAGRADEVGELAAFLCSSAARYITGSTITIDGGLSLMIGQGA